MAKPGSKQSVKAQADEVARLIKSGKKASEVLSERPDLADGVDEYVARLAPRGGGSTGPRSAPPTPTGEVFIR